MQSNNLFPLDRNRYFQGKMLTSRDFEIEQKYYNSKRRILNRCILGAGVVCGLWVYKNDDFQFLPWINFYNMYGRKYGLQLLKNIPLNINDIHSEPDDNAQILGKMVRPKQIRLTAIEGNWALVSVLDVSCYTNTGYIQWRDINGQFYLFPDMK